MFAIPDSHGLLELAVRGTVLLAVAVTLGWLVRRRPAKVRHLLWTTTFALLLALPAVSLLGPAWEVPLLPAPAATNADVQPSVPTPPTPITPEPARELLPPPPTRLSANPAHTPMRAPESPSPPHAVPLPFLLWSLGCAAALTSLLVGILRFGRLVRQAQPVHDPVWLRQVELVRARLDIRRSVPLYFSGQAGTPMTGGFRTPAILLPASAKAWSAGRRQAVLTHELIHVRHRDALRQLILRAALALYWFHPLAWVAARLAASAREEACDEEVLELGARPSQYAEHLLAVAAGGLTPGPSPLSLPMVRHSGPRLERRIAVHSQAAPAAPQHHRHRGCARRGRGCRRFSSRRASDPHPLGGNRQGTNRRKPASTRWIAAELANRAPANRLDRRARRRGRRPVHGRDGRHDSA